MKSYDIPLNEANQADAPPRKQWAKPRVEIIGLETAEAGLNPSSVDGAGAHSVRVRS